jgi:collagenase-like PrtC family protease
MKLAVGYPVLGDEDRPFPEIVDQYRDDIAEVYFASAGEPSGRSPFGMGGDGPDPEAQERLEHDLRAIRALGIRLDLLLNANCYGPAAASPGLAHHVASLVEGLCTRIGLDVVTTASPFIAGTIRERFPSLALRASVNMRIGTTQGMSYLTELFDSFYVQRDHNRDLRRIAELREWAGRNAKELCILVNSGCLSFCSGQTFHDNLVAHESEIESAPDARDTLLCRRFLAHRRNWAALLQATWVRPEDLHYYERLSSLAKLATRMHSRPDRVIAAYASQRLSGNLLDLLEPGYGSLLGGSIIDNALFPADWHQRVTSCAKQCDTCGYCAETLESVLTPVGSVLR